MQLMGFSEILKLFPFALECDQDGTILNRGPAWSRFGIEPGDSCSEIFHIENPAGKPTPFAKPQTLDLNKALILKTNLFKGHLKTVGFTSLGKSILLMTPSLSSEQDLTDFQLSFEDFSPLDPVFDYLILAQSQRMAAREMKNLYEMNQVLARLPEETPFPILRLNGFGEVLYTNGKFQNLFETNDQILTFFKVCKEMIATQEVQQGQSITLTKNIDSRYFILTVVPIEEHGYYNVFVNETTAEVQALKDVQDERSRTIMAAKLSTLGEMAAGIAHEINNPLAIIKGRVQLMNRVLDGLDPKLKEKITKGLQIIDQTTDRIMKIVVGLKNFSRDATNDGNENVKVSQLTQSVVDLLSEKFSHTGVELKCTIPPDLTVEGQVIQLEQVLMNLVTNSFHAIEKNETKWIHVDAQLIGTRIQISIEDSGSGIPADLREKIMLPFFTTKPVGQGTGLGLSISKGIVEKHHGRIYIDENCPHTKFVVELPQRQPQSQPAAA